MWQFCEFPCVHPACTCAFSNSPAKTHNVFDFPVNRGCLTVPSSCILGPITWFHSSYKIAPIHNKTAGGGGRFLLWGGKGGVWVVGGQEKKPPTHNHAFSIGWQGWWQHDHCVIMITPQRHVPPSSRLHSGCRYNLIHCSVGGPDTIMQHVGTGVITVFSREGWKKTDTKKGEKKMEWWGGRNLQLGLSVLTCQSPCWLVLIHFQHFHHCLFTTATSNYN